jgi:MFS family permease
MRFSRFSSNVTTNNIQQDERSSSLETKQQNGYQWTALSVTTVGALLGAIQGSALLIALPNILAELHTTFLTIIWVLLGYLLIVTVLTPIIGCLADLWGRKRLYNAGFVAFTIGSLISGLAQPQFHGGDLIVGRVIQGIGAALLITNSTIIETQYPAVSHQW